MVYFTCYSHSSGKIVEDDFRGVCSILEEARMCLQFLEQIFMPVTGKRNPEEETDLQGKVRRDGEVGYL